jgi:hypothetical protein
MVELCMQKEIEPVFFTDGDAAAFFFIRLPLAEAKARYEVLADRKPLNVEDGIHFGAVGSWSVFADYNPYDLDFEDSDYFFEMAQDEEAVFAMYKTDSCSASLYGKNNGNIIREFIDYSDDCGGEARHVNIGLLPYEQEPVKDWLDAIDLINKLFIL